jgi:hypothetical protein
MVTNSGGFAKKLIAVVVAIMPTSPAKGFVVSRERWVHLLAQ